MKFEDFVCFKATIPELQARDRDGVIAELVSSLNKAGALGKSKSKEIIRMVIERENEASTGMGKGVAVPHVKHKVVKDVVAVIGQSGAGIDFSALDKQPVYSVILLISPVDNPDKHLQAMERVFSGICSMRSSASFSDNAGIWSKLKSFSERPMKTPLYSEVDL